MPIDLNVTGAAVRAQLQTTMTPGSPGAAGTFTVDDATGWPVSGKFAAVIARGLSNEETILLNSRSGVTFTVGQRGYDNTAGQDHAIGEFVELDLPAVLVQALINHENGTDVNPHSGILLNNAAHDVTARHVYGGAYGPGTAVPQAIVPDAGLSPGSSAFPARADHQHSIVNATASTITGTNAEGAAASFARSDHNHQIGGTNHIPVAALVDGSIANGAAALGTNQKLLYIQATNPGAVGAGATWINTAAGKHGILTRNAANTGWEVLAGTTEVEYTPTLTGLSVGGTGAFNKARYSRQGNIIVTHGMVVLGSTGSVTGRIQVGLPFNAKDLSGSYPSNDFFYHAAARASDVSGPTVWAGVGVIGTLANGFPRNIIDFFGTGGVFAWDSGTPFAWAANDKFSYFATFVPESLEDANFV